MHIYLPPSPDVFGMGVMFHRKADGSIWYVSVPLGPPLPDFGVELTPRSGRGKPRRSGDVQPACYCRDNEQRGDLTLGMQVVVYHQVGSNTYPVPFTLNGVESQVDVSGKLSYVDIWPAPLEASYNTTVTVHVQGVESKVVAEIYPLEKYQGFASLPPVPSPDADVYKTNNRAEAKVKPIGQVDIKLTAWTRDGCYYGSTVSVNWKVERKDAGTNPLQVEVTATSKTLGSQSKTITLKGKSAGGYFQFQNAKVGKHTVTVRADLLDGAQDADPRDNAVVVYPEVCQLPDIPRDREMHSELIDQ